MSYKQAVHDQLKHALDILIRLQEMSTDRREIVAARNEVERLGRRLDEIERAELKAA